MVILGHVLFVKNTVQSGGGRSGGCSVGRLVGWSTPVH